MRKLTTEEFIAKADVTHHGKYIYDSVVYTKSTSKVAIICPKHGTFNQRASAHLHGSGCLECGGCKQSSTTEFIAKSEVIHSNKYNYTLTKYINTHSKVNITCDIHGTFSQRPNDHLKGNGCPQCCANVKLSTSSFITKSRQVHGDRYDYSNSVYQSNSSPIIITCSIHGDFLQRPSVHLDGCGCSYCNKVGGYSKEKLTSYLTLGQRMGSLYLVLLSSNDEQFYKVGISSTVSHRLTYMSSTYTVETINIVNMMLIDAFNLEQKILSMFTPYYPTNKFGGHTECLVLTDDDVTNVMKIMTCYA